MKRITSLLFIVTFFAVPAFAEETAAPTTDTVAAPEAAPAAQAAPTVTEPPAPVDASAPTPAVEVPVAVPPAVDAPAEAPVVVPNTENLEFISGEISELDEAGKTLTVKLYGEAETSASDKTLKVNVDANTDITDGEQDRDLKSLTVGTEVDVEYDPATAKATYIFVY